MALITSSVMAEGSWLALESTTSGQEAVTRDLNLVHYLRGHQNDGCEEDSETMRRPGIKKEIYILPAPSSSSASQRVATVNSA